MRATLSTFAVLAAVLATPVTAHAQQDGALVGLHELRREGRSICMVGHFHYGASSGHRTKRLAMRTAVADWAGFTALEYGSHWANWRRARNKGANCERAGSGWTCSISARPCKPAGRSRRSRRRR